MNKVVICTLLTAFIFGSSPLFERILLKDSIFSLQVAAFARLLPSLVVCLLWISFSGGLKELGSIGLKEWGGFGVIGILGSLVGPFLLFVAYRQGEGNISKIGPLLGSFPLFTVILGYTVLKEPITLLQLSGMIMIVGGAILVSMK